MLRYPPSGDVYLCYLVSVLNAELLRKEPVVTGVVQRDGVGVAIADVSGATPEGVAINAILARMRALGQVSP
jgi:hypothetical protein